MNTNESGLKAVVTVRKSSGAPAFIFPVRIYLCLAAGGEVSKSNATRSEDYIFVNENSRATARMRRKLAFFSELAVRVNNHEISFDDAKLEIEKKCM